jgi:metal-responsive CopG/Arc/MetJ family transcriptional regulator
MKTAISLPDQLFERAERMATLAGVSRSQLYAQAISDYLDKHEPDSITQAFNAVYETEPSELDPVLMRMQLLSLPQGEW